MVRAWYVGTLSEFTYLTYQTYHTYWYGMCYVQPAAVNEDLCIRAQLHIQLKIHNIALVARPVFDPHSYLI